MTWFFGKSLPNGSARWRSTLTPLAGELPVLVTAAVTETVPPGWIDVGDAEMLRTANATPGVDVPTASVSALFFQRSIFVQWSVNTPTLIVYVPDG